MSRIGKNPVPIPEKVSVEISGLTVKVKGPKGELERVLPEGVSVSQADNAVTVSPIDTSRRSRERHGLCRTLVANMVEGGKTPFLGKKELQLVLVLRALCTVPRALNALPHAHVHPSRQDELEAQGLAGVAGGGDADLGGAHHTNVHTVATGLGIGLDGRQHV